MEPPKYKILLVDDDTFLLNMYSMKFAKSGFAVTTCANATDALKKLEDGYLPDIMLLDIIMPGMDGLALLEQIRAKNLAPKAVIIMLTNQSESADIEKAKDLKVQGYIVKATTIPSEVITQVSSIYESSKTA